MTLMIDTPGLTFVFLSIVAGLATALVALFCSLERSARVVQLRAALVRRVGADVNDRHQ